MGLRGACSLGEDFKVIIWEASYKGMGLFFAGGVTPQDNVYFNFAIGGEMKRMKWLKNGAGKDFIFHELFLHYILYGEHFIGSVKEPWYSVCVNLNHEKTK